MLYMLFSEKSFPDIQSKPALAQLEAAFLVLRLMYMPDLHVYAEIPHGL